MKKILFSLILSVAGMCTTFAAEPVKGIIVTYDGADTCSVGSYSVSDPHLFLPAAGYRDGEIVKK